MSGILLSSQGQLTDAKKHSPINVIDELRDLIVSAVHVRCERFLHEQDARSCSR